MLHRSATALLCLLPTLAAQELPAGGGAQQEVPRSTATQELFLANCASCHGERGDGEGATDLDRRARSFLDGGFSYGNTPETVRRTITSGIPGTPMPAFGEALSERQIADLALYVIELGPGLPEPPANTELVVAELPLVVRGMLPPIAEGAPTRPRGLLIGTPDGFSFEYRSDDVRLLGMRQGRFVDRTDWIGRGGTALAPLGTVVALVEGGDPGPTFSAVGGARPGALAAGLRGTWVGLHELPSGPVPIAQVQYGLLDGGGEPLVLVRESIRAASPGTAAGYRRQWLLTARSILDFDLRLGPVRAPGVEELPGADPAFRWFRRRVEGEREELLLLHVYSPEDRPAGAPWDLRFAGELWETLRLLVVVLPPGELSEAELAELKRAMVFEVKR